MNKETAVHWMRSNNLEEKITNPPNVTWDTDKDSGIVCIYIDGVLVVEWVSDEGDPSQLIDDFKRILYIGCLI